MPLIPIPPPLPLTIPVKKLSVAEKLIEVEQQARAAGVAWDIPSDQLEPATLRVTQLKRAMNDLIGAKNKLQDAIEKNNLALKQKQEAVSAQLLALQKEKTAHRCLLDISRNGTNAIKSLSELHDKLDVLKKLKDAAILNKDDAEKKSAAIAAEISVVELQKKEAEKVLDGLMKTFYSAHKKLCEATIDKKQLKKDEELKKTCYENSNLYLSLSEGEQQQALKKKDNAEANLQEGDYEKANLFFARQAVQQEQKNIKQRKAQAQQSLKIQDTQKECMQLFVDLDDAEKMLDKTPREDVVARKKAKRQVRETRQLLMQARSTLQEIESNSASDLSHSSFPLKRELEAQLKKKRIIANLRDSDSDSDSLLQNNALSGLIHRIPVEKNNSDKEEQVRKWPVELAKQRVNLGHSTFFIEKTRHHARGEHKPIKASPSQ